MQKPTINICLGSSCFSRGNEANLEAITNFMKKHHLRDEVDLELSCCLCQGACTEGPNISIDNKQYYVPTPAVIIDILTQRFKKYVSGGANE